MRGDGLNADYVRVIRVLAKDSAEATSHLINQLETLSGWQNELRGLGAPDLMLKHPGVRLNYVDQVLDELEKSL